MADQAGASSNLAGAIGVPTWVILPEQNVDWRWGCEGEATSWDASMRLLRRAGVAAAVQRLDEWCRTRGLEARQDT